MSDAELNKAALLIAKLLIRTREGRIKWNHLGGSMLAPVLGGACLYSASLEDNIEAIITEDNKQLGFALSGSPFNSLLPAPTDNPEVAIKAVLENPKAIALDHSYGSEEALSPESIVYRDLRELIYLAGNPESVSDDLRYQQALTYLDKLSA